MSAAMNMVFHELECTVCGDKFLWNPDTDGSLIDCECGNDAFENIITCEIEKSKNK